MRKRKKDSTPETATAAPKASRARTTLEHLKAPFLPAFKADARISAAAERVGVGISTVYDWRKNDSDFQKELNRLDIEARAKDDEAIERSAIHRVKNGDPEYLIKNGQNVMQVDADGKPMLDAQGRPIPVIVRRRFDGQLTIFLMETRMPERYSRKLKAEISGEVIISMTSELLSILQRQIPDFCPHCKMALALKPAIATQLAELCARMGKPIVSTETPAA